MKDEIRQQFEQAIASRQLRDEQALEASNQQQAQIRQAEDEWNEKIDQVIKPALQEIEAMLKPAGWVTNIKLNEKKALVFEIYKGNMRAVGGADRPHVWFSLDSKTRRVQTYVASISTGAAGSVYDLADLTTDAVQTFALDFFKKLAG